ncbi:HD domain-containing protein [archaeon]|nr:MAG: HD domain-containing protein [archaeon]
MRSIVTDINYPEISNEILSLWLAYEEQNSYEAQIAHQLDKLEMIIQANEYEKAHAGQVLTSFFTSTADDFHHPEVLAWAEAVREERRARLACKM